MNTMINNPLGIDSKQTAMASIESNKAIAEVHAAMSIARLYPRNQITAMDKILNACTRLSLAETAMYSYSKGGTEVTGASIRLAETMAQNWGNIQFGFNELARGLDYDNVTYSEVGAYAWDLETNTKKPLVFRVRHWRDTKNGGYPLKDERDIYELIANIAQRRVRACLLSLLPGDVVEAAVNQCEVTLKAKADNSPEGIKKLLDAFLEKFGVTQQQIEKFIQRRSETMQPAQIIKLRKIYSSLKDGMSKPSDWFEEITATEPEDPINQAIKGKQNNEPPQQGPKSEAKTKADIKPETEETEETNWLQRIENAQNHEELKSIAESIPAERKEEFAQAIVDHADFLRSVV